jgi:hypothetical protein
MKHLKLWLARTACRWAGLAAVRPLPFSRKHGLTFVVWANGDESVVDFVTGKIEHVQNGVEV